MRAIRLSVLGVGILCCLVTTGCDKAGTTSAAGPSDKPTSMPTSAVAEPNRSQDPVRVMLDYADEICACADPACVERAQKKMAAEGDRKQWAAKRPSDADMKIIMAVMEKMQACANKAAGRSTRKDPVLMMEDYANQMCACADRTCVQDVQKKMAEEGKEGDKGEKPSDEDMKKIMAAMEKMQKCAEQAAAPRSTGDPVKMMAGYADETCACKDEACIEGVQKKMAAVGKDKVDKPSDADMTKIMVSMERMQKCAVRVRSSR